MGLHVSSYTKNKDAALAYVKWFESKDTQLAWAQAGRLLGPQVGAGQRHFQNAAPYNPVFAEAYQDVKDFWNIPEYNQMLQTQMEQLNLAITGQEDPSRRSTRSPRSSRRSSTSLSERPAEERQQRDSQ